MSDRAIHELIGGGCWHESDDTERALVECRHCRNKFILHLWDRVNPDYENDISAAMEAVEQLRREKKWGFDLWTEGEEWCAMVDATVRDESLSKAICAAILAAASGEELVGGQ